MLSEFSAPPTVTCFLCKAWISVKKGDKTRFLHHISSDHEVHFDLELVFVLSTMAEEQREAIVNNNLESDGEKEKVSETSKEVEKIDNIQGQLGLKRLRVDIERIPMDEDVPHREAHQDPPPQSSRRSKLVKFSKCNQRMKRANLKSHIAANHKKGRKSGQKTEDGLVEKVDVKDMVDCLFCEEKMAVGDQRAHMRNVHKTDIDPKTLKQEVVSLENSRDIKMPPPKLEPTDPAPKVKCEICHKKVAASKLKNHLTRLHPDLSAKCGLCYEMFAKKEKLRQHISLVHPSETEFLNPRLEPAFSSEECRVACGNCDLTFITVSSRDHHAMVNHQFSQYSPITLS